jgi:hypothetical protein
MAKFIYKGSDIRRFSIEDKEHCLVPGKECELPDTDYVRTLEERKVILRCVKQQKPKVVQEDHAEKKDEPKITE